LSDSYQNFLRLGRKGEESNDDRTNIQKGWEMYVLVYGRKEGMRLGTKIIKQREKGA
jgi:hypothetical protein